MQLLVETFEFCQNSGQDSRFQPTRLPDYRQKNIVLN